MRRREETYSFLSLEEMGKPIAGEGGNDSFFIGIGPKGKKNIPFPSRGGGVKEGKGGDAPSMGKGAISGNV